PYQYTTFYPYAGPLFGQFGSRDRSVIDFLQWCDRVGLVLSTKVSQTVAGYGMLAKDHIPEGELLFTVPRSALLHQGTTKISALLEGEKSCLESESGWVPLLLSLLYEYTSPLSHWKPYLSLDLANIQQEYSDVVLPFITKHLHLWDPNTHTLELYIQLVAFVMAYSFQEPRDESDNEDDNDDEEEEEKPLNLPMMVPMADMLNHVSNHNANLEFTLKMVAIRPIAKGEEVFNTYGQMANWQLLHMYGFTEPYASNSNDTADVPIRHFYEVLTQGIQSDLEQQLLKKKWETVNEILQEKAAFVFGKHGCLTDTELHTALKILCMSKEEFSEFEDNEGWEEDDEDEETISQAFSNDGLPELNASWKRLLHEAARLTLKSYGDREEEVEVWMDRDRRLMEDKAGVAGLSSRQQNALQVCYGQKKILYKLMELTK
uniref:N-lysine methyltransferase SETD6 n=1 Tax=Gouania willdenowi TaxID=441366 RepID=A0A8C5H6Q0_GOUWI